MVRIFQERTIGPERRTAQERRLVAKHGAVLFVEKRCGRCCCGAVGTQLLLDEIVKEARERGFEQLNEQKGQVVSHQSTRRSG